MFFNVFRNTTRGIMKGFANVPFTFMELFHNFFMKCPAGPRFSFKDPSFFFFSVLPVLPAASCCSCDSYTITTDRYKA